MPLPEAPSSSRADARRRCATAVLDALPDADALVMAAAVADFRPARTSDTKIARDGDGLTLELEPTDDILAEAVRVARADARTRGSP